MGCFAGVSQTFLHLHLMGCGSAVLSIILSLARAFAHLHPMGLKRNGDLAVRDGNRGTLSLLSASD